MKRERPTHPIIRDLIAKRDETGESLQAVANRAGITRSALFKIEGGKSDPRLSTLQGLAEAFGGRLSVQMIFTSLPPAPHTQETP